MMEAMQRPSASYHVAVAVLVVLLLTAATLIISMAVRPGAPAAHAEVSTIQEPSHCHPAAPGSVCFDNVVQNAGATAATFLCDVSSTDAGQASFPPGTSDIEVTCFEARADAAWEPVLNEEHDDHRWCSLADAAVLYRWSDARAMLLRAGEALAG